MIDEKDYYIYLKKKQTKNQCEVAIHVKSWGTFCFFPEFPNPELHTCISNRSHQFSETLRLLEEVHLD